MDYRQVPHGHLAIGTQLLSRPAAEEPGYPWDERVPPLGRDGTLLAIVPIPGTQTSLAIVGYAISTAAAPRHAPAAPDGAPEHPAQDAAREPPPPDAAPERTAAGEPDSGGLLIDRVQRRVWADDGEIPLTFQEFELLAFLSAHPAVVFSRADLVQRVWQPPEAPARPNVRSGSRTVR